MRLRRSAYKGTVLTEVSLFTHELMQVCLYNTLSDAPLRGRCD